MERQSWVRCHVRNLGGRSADGDLGAAVMSGREHLPLEMWLKGEAAWMWTQAAHCWWWQRWKRHQFEALAREYSERAREAKLMRRLLVKGTLADAIALADMDFERIVRERA